MLRVEQAVRARIQVAILPGKHIGIRVKLLYGHERVEYVRFYRHGERLSGHLVVYQAGIHVHGLLSTIEHYELVPAVIARAYEARLSAGYVDERKGVAARAYVVVQVQLASVQQVLEGFKAVSILGTACIYIGHGLPRGIAGLLAVKHHVKQSHVRGQRHAAYHKSRKRRRQQQPLARNMPPRRCG